MLRRPSARIPDLISGGELTIDLRQAKVFRNGAEIRLVLKEFDLLAFLIRHHGQCLSAEALLERVWCSKTKRCNYNFFLYERARNLIPSIIAPAGFDAIERRPARNPALTPL